ncbi:MAG: response regulator transcription factor [Ardenticatenaceae bacterium]|nr:response regulator transcription factor [Anaerolineales bacterium]MCB8922968.1 response regulator transcription factor [Ardenticatenaceae bacterium]MCB8990299.1 response regulator transcription factor [Ardenticatenaceae bacterium]
MIRVLLADQHRLLHPAIRTLLSTTDDMTLVGEVTDRHELRQNCEEFCPDILLLSTNVTDSPLVKILDDIKEQCPTSKILVMLSSTEETSLRQLVAQGVNGVILKSDTPGKLLEAIDAIAQGQTWVSIDLLPRLVQPQQANVGNDVTDRELEILQLLALEKTNAEIAQTMNIADRTVRSHLENIYIKLGVTSRVGAVVQAIRLNLISK